MREEIIELCEKIKNKNTCTTCGGNHKNGICDFCGKENHEMIYLSLQLEKVLKKASDTFNKGTLDNALTALFSIRSLDISIVSQVLTDYNYWDIVFDNYSYILDNVSNIINNNCLLSKEQYDLIFNNLLSKDFRGDSENIFANIIIKAIIEKNEKLNITKEQKEKFFLYITEMIANNIIGFKVSHAKIQDDVIPECDSLASASHNYVFLTREVIHNNPDNIFPPVFHELIHLKQYKEQKMDHILSNKNLMQIKDRLIRKVIPTYYKENYINISYEKEAYYYEEKETIDYFNCINVPVSEHINNMAIYNDGRCCDFLTNISRTIDGKDTTVFELFDNIVVEHPEFLADYPQLSFEYKLENGSVSKKSLEDITNDFNNFQIGQLKWNGNQEEINTMYQSLINKLEVEKNVSK